MQVIIYTRISRDRASAGLGVERQRADCQALADRLGWTVVDTFSDNDITAYSGKRRPGYDAMCDALKAGRAQAVLAWHTDRLHRRPIELESFIDLCDAQQVEVQTVTSGGLDLGTSSGKMVARMLGAAARHEVEHAIERQRNAKKQAAMEGRYRGGRRAFGYQQDGVTAEPREADAIRQAARDVLAGVSLRQIARTWNELGLRTSFEGKSFDSRTVREILLRPRNAALSMHEGKVVGTGNWEQILDRDTFHAVEAVLRDPARRTQVSTERKYQGSGVYLCGKCGGEMVAAVHNQGPEGWTHVYVCAQHRHLARDQKHLDAYIDEIVIGVLSRPGTDGLNVSSLFGVPSDLTELQAKRSALRGKLDNLAQMFSRDEINGDQLRVGSADLRYQLQVVETRLAAAQESSALAAILTGEDLREAWANAPADVRGKVIDVLMSVTILPAKRGRKPGGQYFDPTSVRINPRV